MPPKIAVKPAPLMDAKSALPPISAEMPSVSRICTKSTSNPSSR